MWFNERVTRVLYFALCAAVFTAAPASAQSAGEARELFVEGRDFMRDGRFADARDAFLRSLELNPRPSVAFNLAVAYTRTGEYVAAVGLFDRLLEGDFGNLPRDKRREVRTLRAEAEGSVALLTIHLPPAEGLNVRVDGQRYEGPMRVDPGEHIVSLTSPRHVPLELRVALERGGEETVDPELELREDERLGRLRITTPVDGGLLTIEGVAEGEDELDERLPPGEYVVTLQDGDEHSERVVQVEAGVEVRYELSFEQSSSRRAWPWIVAGVLVAGAGASVAAYFLTRPTQREDPVFGSFTTLRAPAGR